MTSPSDEKGEHSVSFRPDYRWQSDASRSEEYDVDQHIGSSLPQFLLGYTCPARRGIVVQERAYIDEIPAAFLFQIILQLHQQR